METTKTVFDKFGHFDMFLPIDVSKTSKINKSNEDDNYVVIAGWASTPTWDTQQESVEPIGIDASYFEDAGWINYEHNDDEVIGIPTSNTFTDPNKGLYVEAKLFKDNPHVQTILDLYEQLEKLHSPRKLGFSIEGQVKERDADNPNIIKSVWITAVAVTKNPSNPDATWDLLQKSNAAEVGYAVNPEDKEGISALVPESLSSKVTQLSYGLANLDKPRLMEIAQGALKILSDRPSTSPLAKVILLQITSGLSRKDAIEQLVSHKDV